MRWCDRGLGGSHTVDGDGDGLRESEAILAEEGGNLSKSAGLEVLDGGVAELNIGVVQLDIVGLRDSLDGSAAGVALEEQVSQSNHLESSDEERGIVAYRLGEESSENHLG